MKSFRIVNICGIKKWGYVDNVDKLVDIPEKTVDRKKRESGV